MNKPNPFIVAAILAPVALAAWVVLAVIAYSIGAGASAVIDIISRSL